MAKRENIANLHATFTLSASEMIALVEIISKASAGEPLSTLHQHNQARKFAIMFALSSDSGDYRIPK